MTTETRERYDELCRLCASYDAIKMDIFGQEGNNRQLVDKIQTCLPFKIAENDRLPKCLCYRCMYNLENFYDFRTACVNAVALLEKNLPPKEEKTCVEDDTFHYPKIKVEPTEKENMPILIPEAPVVNPNAALGTPPRLNSDGEADHEIEEILEHSTEEDDAEDRKSDEYEMDMETNPSDFLEMTSIVTDDPEEGNSRNVSAAASGMFQHTSEQHEVYVCSLCNKAFSSKGHLSLHARIHVGAGDVIGERVITDDHTSYKRPYQCDLCNKSYSTAKHRWGHVSTTHRGHPAVTCGYCSRIYSTRINLEEHIKSRHAGLPPPPELPAPYVQTDTRYQCKTCPKMYTNVTDLNKHSRLCLGDRQINRGGAAAKSKGFIDTSDLSSMDSDMDCRDYKNAEAKLAKNPQLTILKQALTKGDTLKRDYEDKNKTSCGKPKKAARTGDNCVQDKAECDGKKRWYCEVCPQNFATLEGLREHEHSHESDKPYICVLCDKDFVLKSSLSRHIVTSHGVDPAPIVDSDKCLKKSAFMRNKHSLAQPKVEPMTKEYSQSPVPAEANAENDEEEHVSNDNMIEIETVFVCEICTRDFNDRASLWLHIRATHKESAAFACGVCLKICSDNAQLLNHVNMYHGGSKLLVSEQRRYSCTICGRQHDSRKKLITHVSIHNVDPAYDPASFVQLNSNYYSENFNSEMNEQSMEMDALEEGEKVDCYICYKSFPNEDHLIRHQRNAHKSEPITPVGDCSNGTGSNGNGNRAQYHLFFVCELCGSSHPSKWERWLHVSSAHGNETSIRCEREDCAKIFATKSLRNEHAQHHLIQGASPNTCEICGKLWGSRVDYWKHVMGVHSDTVPLICGVCLKVFPDVIQLSAHVRANHWPLTNGDFSCDICGRPYSNKSKMSRHRKIHGLDVECFTNNSMSEAIVEPKIEHYGPSEVDLGCEMCVDVKFPNFDELCNHRRTVHGLFPCDLCNKCYGRTSHLWKHVNRVHKGHADVTCKYCMKTSASRDHLAAHIAKIHRYELDVKSDSRDLASLKAANVDEETLHYCEKCNKAFHKRYLLRRHMKGCQNYRKDPGALLTRCRACERIFKDRASLQKHIENHHSTYTCHLCDETITSKLAIMTHNRVNHMNHPDLTCNHNNCKKLFRTKEDLESHKKDHKYHNNPNVCDFCGDTVENKLKLKMHILSLHRNEIGVSCGVCLIPMKDPKDLKKHVEEVHASILSKPNTCRVCGKQYASKWKAFDHTKKCHGKVFRTCKQCLAVFTSDGELRNHYEHVHNVSKDQLAAYEHRIDNSSKGDDGSDLAIKEEPEDMEFDDEAYNEDSSESKRKRATTDTYDCEICPEIFLKYETLAEHYANVHNTDPMRMFKKKKQEGSGKSKKKMRDRENFECKNCRKQFCTKILFWNHMEACTRRKSDAKGSPTMSTSILEAHLKNNNQMKVEEQQDMSLNENNLNIPDFNLFETLDMQLSGQKPESMSHAKSPVNSKLHRKDSRKVYDETTNTECVCEVCGKQWPAKKHLWQHLIRFHRAEAAVTCGVCLKLCTNYEDLAEHLRTHHEAILTCEGNNFTCKTCGRYHNARSKLFLHTSIHINYNGNFWCSVCQQNLETKERLEEHSATCVAKQPEEGSAEADEAKDSREIKQEDEEESVAEEEYESEVEGEEASGVTSPQNDENQSGEDSDSESSSDSGSDDSDSDRGSNSSDDDEAGVEGESTKVEDSEEGMSDSDDESQIDVKQEDTSKADTEDYSDDDGPPVLSPMMPLLEDRNVDESMSEISHKLSPMVSLDNKEEPQDETSNDSDDNSSLAKNDSVDEPMEEDSQQFESVDPFAPMEQDSDDENEQTTEDNVQIQDMGTVLMVGKDEDGNQIFIEQNLELDLENESSEVAGYVYEEGAEYDLEDFQQQEAQEQDEDESGA